MIESERSCFLCQYLILTEVTHLFRPDRFHTVAGRWKAQEPHLSQVTDSDQSHAYNVRIGSVGQSAQIVIQCHLSGLIGVRFPVETISLVSQLVGLISWSSDHLLICALRRAVYHD